MAKVEVSAKVLLSSCSRACIRPSTRRTACMPCKQCISVFLLLLLLILLSLFSITVIIVARQIFVC